MKFYEDQLFHIYNQGNNKRQIFFSDDNFEYFLWKMRTYLVPFGDFVAYCLMPTHFHWLFYVKKVTVPRKVFRVHADKIEWMRRVHKYSEKAQVVKRNWSKIAHEDSLISLNDAIGDLESSYTRAINKQENWTGSLFREDCKAKDGWIDEFITLKHKNGKDDFRFKAGTDYGYQCLDYIHENPKEAGIVTCSTEYPWSSAKDYAGLRRGTLCNLELGQQLQHFC